MNILSLAHYVPKKVLKNDDLTCMVDTSDEWIYTRTGIRERHIAADDEENSDMALAASRQALDQAGLQPGDIDAIIAATCTPDMTMPGMSSSLQGKLGNEHAMTFDLNAACSGFIYSLDVADSLISSGRYRNVLIACSERFRPIVNYKDRGTCILFGDGAGCLIVGSKAGRPEMKAVYCGGNGSLRHLLRRPGGGSSLPLQRCEDPADMYIKMEGREVFKHAVRGMLHSAEQTLARAGWGAAEVDWLVPHQANARLIEAAREKFAMPPEKVIMNIEHYGNTSSASIPIALSEARARFQPGQRILCLAFGAGFTWGGSAFTWGEL